MKVTFFQKVSQYIALILSLVSSSVLLISAMLLSLRIYDGHINFQGALYYLLVALISFCLLYALLGLYSCIICVIYDWTTSITIDKRMRDVVYYNRYTGTIKFNADDIIEITELSKDHPRLMISYTRIVLRNGVKILLGQFVDAECISDLSPVDCKRDHKESIAYEELLISMIRRKHS